jgi:hypothetical protein
MNAFLKEKDDHYLKDENNNCNDLKFSGKFAVDRQL